MTVLRVVAGNPSAEELAVLTAVVSAAGSGGAAPPAVRRGRWNDPAAAHRRAWQPGPGGWQAATRMR